MTKYKEYVGRMLEQNSEFFARFRTVHDEYALNQEAHQAEYNDIGQHAQAIIKEWEGRLCKHSEAAGYSTFVGKLAEKFQDEVRREFPMIDWIGVINKSPEPEFVIKRINLF